MSLAVGDPRRSFLHHLVDELPECATWSISPYWRCDLRCTYCITGAQGRSEARVTRADAAGQLRDELADVPLDARVTLGSISDAYPSIEAELGLTREILAELVRQGRPISVVTKSTTVVRDIDLLGAGDAQVTFSLATASDDDARVLEPHAPSVGDRLTAALELRRAKIPTWISATPWIPGVSDAAAIIERVRTVVGPVPIIFGPLNVRAAPVATSLYGRPFSQAEVNEAFLEEHHRVGEHPGVRWLRPQPLEGHTSHTDALRAYTDDDVAGPDAVDAGTSVPVAAPRRLTRPLDRTASV